MFLILLVQIKMHMTRKVLMHVKPHALIIHILQEIIVIVAIVLLSVYRHSLDYHAVNYVCLFNITN